MTAESLWDLFVRTGLPEAYSLYHRSTSGTTGDIFGQPFRDPFLAGWHESHDSHEQNRGT